jgi:hypothetical protein
MGTRNRVGIGLSYRHARLHRLAEFIPWNRFLGSMHKRLKIRAQASGVEFVMLNLWSGRGGGGLEESGWLMILCKCYERCHRPAEGLSILVLARDNG